MTDLAELIARLEAASQGSRPLDREMMLLVGDAREVDHCTFYGPDESVWYLGDYEHETDLPPLPYLTSSLDAIVALIERKLPGWWVQYLGQTTKGWAARIERQGTSLGLFNSTTPALALCIAFLRALQAQQETFEDE